MEIEDINDEDYLDKYTNEIAIVLIVLLIVILIVAVVIFKNMGLM